MSMTDIGSLYPRFIFVFKDSSAMHISANKTVSLLIAIFYLNYGLFAQYQHEIDSVQRILKTEKSEPAKSLMYNRLAYDYHFNNPNTAVKYADSALWIALKYNDEENIDRAFYNKGISYIAMSDFHNCVDCFTKTLQLAQKQKNQIRISQSYGYLGVCYRHADRQQEAIEYMIKALKAAEKAGNKKSIASCCNNIANVLSDLEQNDEAIEYLERGIEVARSNNDDENLAIGYSNMAELLMTEDPEKSRELILKALEVDKKMNNLRGISIDYSNLGALEFNSGNFEDALEMITLANEIDLQIGAPEAVSVNYNNIAAIHKEMKNYTRAIEFYTKSLAISDTLERKTDYAASQFGLAECYAAKGDMKTAYGLIYEYVKLKEQLFSDETSKAVADLKTKYETEKKELEIKSLKNQSEIDSLQIEKVNLLNAETERKKNVQFYSFTAGLLVLLAIALLIYRGFKQKQKANLIISAQKAEVEKQKEIVEEKNKEILDSITYAKRLQEAILPPQKLVKEYFNDSFILYKPKDIVAGDFYFLEPFKDKIIFAAADCTGHGVPGAMVSVVCSNALNRTVKEFGISDSGEILNKVRELVMETFSKSESEVKDGMDISLCVLDHSKNEMLWSGANNPLWIVRNNSDQIEEYKPDKQPIGRYADAHPFATQKILLQKGDSVFIFTDGFADQFGGEAGSKSGGKKFKASRMKELFLSIRDLPMEKQKNMINEAFEKWKGELEQIDDVCVIGVRI
ncbi:MAG: tetratricopeptide repeat protein [Bacteroidota bacterium]